MSYKKEIRRLLKESEDNEIQIGFSIATTDERVIKDNANERWGANYGEPEEGAEFVKAGFIETEKDGDVKITSKGWSQLNKDIERIERNMLNIMRRVLSGASDEGHNDDSLVGSAWIDPNNKKHLEIVNGEFGDGRESYQGTGSGTLDRVFDKWTDGVSDFCLSIIDVSLYFFYEKDGQTLEDIIEGDFKLYAEQ